MLEIDELITKVRNAPEWGPLGHYLPPVVDAPEIQLETEKIMAAVWAVLMREGKDKPWPVYLELASNFAGLLLMSVIKEMPQHQKECGHAFIGRVVANMALYLEEVVQQRLAKGP